jgi:hypothetical protein
MDDRSDVEWRVLNLRLSVFLPQTRDVGVEDWRLVTGSDSPETQIQQFGMKQLSGSALGAQLIVASLPGRIDIILMQKPQVSGSPSEFPTGADAPIFVGEFFQALAAFREATSHWLANVSFDVLRVAFGATLLSPCKDRAESYARLGSLLRSVNVVPQSMRDLTFVVNWPTPSRVLSETSLNRITKWANVEIRGRLEAQASPSSPNLAVDTIIVQGPQLELDLSTPAPLQTAAPLSRAKLAPIYEELLELAAENARAGEIPCP